MAFASGQSKCFKLTVASTNGVNFEAGLLVYATNGEWVEQNLFKMA